jgi:predicted dehydrogenase
MPPPEIEPGARRHARGDRLRVGVIGCGHWGPYLVRNLQNVPDVEVVGIAERRPDRLACARRRYPQVRSFTDHTELLDSGVDAVVLATPVDTHFALASEALLAGKHVLVEKPLATSVTDAAELVRLARDVDRTLMVGHTFLYNPAVRELHRMVEAGELGQIYHADSARLNLGQFQRRCNVLWDLAPHDVSILIHVLGQVPVRVSARGSACVQPEVHDVCYLELIFPDGSAHVHVSWLDPDKVRRLTIVGDRRMAVYDDVSRVEKLRIYDRGVESAAADDRGELELVYRHGQIVVPHIAWREPLRLECEHFAECVRTGARPLTDGEQGLVVVAVLEAATRSLESGGMRVPVAFSIAPVEAVG